MKAVNHFTKGLRMIMIETYRWTLILEKQPQKSLVDMWVKLVQFQMITSQVQSSRPCDSTSCECHWWISAKLDLCPTFPSRTGIQNQYWLWYFSHNTICLGRLLTQFVLTKKKKLWEDTKLLEKPVLVKMWLQILSHIHN